jgi:predicted nuclease of predicted toxin-antitoxin system
MTSFLVDEDMPRSTARVLRQAGYEAEDVRDLGLGGHIDDEVFEVAQSRGAVLVSRDLGFTNILRFPLGTHAGIIVIRVRSDVPPPRVNLELLTALSELPTENLRGLLVIVQLGRRRVRHPPPSGSAS